MSSNVAKLLEVLDEDIKRFDAQSNRHKRLHRRVQTAVIALTAATTVVAGAGLVMPANSHSTVQFAVLVLAAATSAATSWAEGRRTRELWQHEREIFWALSDIRRELNFYNAWKELTPAEVEEYFKRASSVLGASMSKWTGILAKEQQKK